MSAGRDRYELLKGLHLEEENRPVNDTDANRIELTGTVADVQHKTTASGKSFIVANIEVRRTWVDRSGNEQERLDTIPVTSWRRGSRLAVGTRVEVQGRLTSRSYTGRTDGVVRLAIDVNAESIEPLDDPGAGQPRDASSESRPRHDEGGFGSSAGPAASRTPGGPLDDSDIPF